MISHKICFFVDSRSASYYPQNVFLGRAGTLLMITHRVCIFVRSRDASDDYPQNMFLWRAERLLMITHKICYCGQLRGF